jgi:methylated-DNA-[protein]-cysteine S-methyltransferase
MPVTCYQTPIGVAYITEEDGCISSISVKDAITHAADDETPLLKEAVKQLDEYFNGKRQTFTLPLQQKGTAFQQEVWEYLLQISYGDTVSYGQLSKRMQNPLAIRAIAAANGKNNLWIVVPCHRVIGAGGALTGYAGGLWRKKWLLEHESRVAGKGQATLFG